DQLAGQVKGRAVPGGDIVLILPQPAEPRPAEDATKTAPRDGGGAGATRGLELQRDRLAPPPARATAPRGDHPAGPPRGGPGRAPKGGHWPRPWRPTGRPSGPSWSCAGRPPSGWRCSNGPSCRSGSWRSWWPRG